MVVGLDRILILIHQPFDYYFIVPRPDFTSGHIFFLIY